MKKPLFPKKPGKQQDTPEHVSHVRRKPVQCLYGPPPMLRPVKPKAVEDDEEKKTKI